MRTLLLGAQSQLGYDILRTWPEGAVTPLGHGDCDVTDLAAVRAAVAGARPQLVINLAAWHRVDDIERDPAEALRVNAHGAWCAATAAAEHGAAVMWISTDYVFRGLPGRPYRESDPADPVNVYGVTKAAGERLIALANPRHFVVRSSGLYGVAGASGKGGNFIETMLRLAREGKPLRVVGDQVLGPTATSDLAQALLALARAGAYGIAHLTNAGAISWHDFALLAFRLCGVRPALTAVTSAKYGAPAARPAYSVLENGLAREVGIPPLRPVEEALAAYLREKGHLSA